MAIAWRKYAGSKAFFRHESEMGHAIEPFTIVAYVHRQLLHKKKDVVYGLLFLLHDLAGLESRNPTRNLPTFNTAVLMCLLVAENQLRCFVRHNQRQKTTLTSSCAALKSWNILQLIHLKLTR